MPLGTDDYDVVIGVNISDQTAAGSAQVRGNVTKMSDDIRKYGDKQAREFARSSRDLFSQTDQHITRSSKNLMSRLTQVFEQNNFLLRNLAYHSGSTAAAVAIGLGKVALSFRRIGKDTEDASHRSRVALMDIKSAVARLGTDADAFPAAIRATQQLSASYEAMGRSGHAASLKAGAALEDIVHKRLVTLQGGLLKAQTNFEKLRVGASRDSDLLGKKVNEISASVSNLLGGAKVDAPFFRSFIKARTEADKYRLVLDKLGPKAAVAFASNQSAIEKLSTAYVRLESRATRAIKSQADKLTEASAKVTNYKNELALLEKGLVGVTGKADDAAVATSGFATAIGVGSVAVGALLAVILLTVAAVVGLTVVMYKSATSAAKYGDEIYKLALSTGLTVKTLSALSVIARETSTDVDSLAKTFTRTQIQVQRGLDKPFSEAGRALRTLRVDFQELRKANPDQQVFMLAKAFTELNNQNVRATVSQQLFSRDAERQAKMLEQVANGFTIAQQKAKKFGLELDETGAVKAHMAMVAATDLKLAWEGLWVSVGIRILPQLTLLMESFVEMVLRTGGAFETLGGMATFALREIRIELETLRSDWEILSSGSLIAPGVALLTRRARRRAAEETINKQDVERTNEYIKRAEELRRRGLQGDDLYAAGRGQKSPMDRLQDQVKRLRFEIEALQDVGSKEFKLRFELEELQKVKAGFESIFKLRNEMGLTLDEPVPQFRVFGTPEEQRQDLANIQSYIKQIERMKTVFEGVRKVANEQSDALAELARVQQEALMPVVDAGILAEIKYQTAIRDRAKAEKELTADVLAETRLRKDAIADEVGATLKAYMTLHRDLGRSQDTLREQRKQDEVFLKIIRGDLDAESDIREQIKERIGSTDIPIVPTELMTIAAHAATIDLNVAAIAEKVGANVKNISNTNIASPASDTGYAISRLVRRNPDGSVSIVSEEDLDSDVVKSATTDIGSTRRRIFEESRERAGAERDAANRKANQEIIDNNMRMEQSLIDLDTDYLQHYGAMQVARRNEARATVVAIMLLENDLKNLENANSELYKDTWKEADKARLESHKALKTSIIDLQNAIANNGFDQADREKRAYLQAIRDIQEASNQARESIIYNQVKIADSTIYHAEIADAAVLDFLANQRSITEVIADAKISVIDSTFSTIDRGLEKITDKLGLAGKLVKDLLSGFIRLALSSLFKTMFGPQPGTTGGVGGIFGTGPGGGGNQGGLGNALYSFLRLGGSNAGASPAGGLDVLGGLLRNSASAGTQSQFPFGNAINLPFLSPPTSLTQQAAATGPGGQLAQLGQLLGIPSGGVPGGAAGTTGVGGGLAGLGTSLAAMAPILGLGLGATIGGESRGGQVLGAAGGLLGGLGLAAIFAPSSAGALGLGTVGAALGLTATTTLIATFGIAAPLLIGAYFLRRNAARRRDERTRDSLMVDSLAQLNEIHNAIRRGRMEGEEGIQQALQIRQQYVAAAESLKDGKTRRIALMDVNRLDAIIGKIRGAADEQIRRREIVARIVPEFASGGHVTFSGRVPGVYDQRDDKLIRVSGNEAVLTPRHVQKLGGPEAMRAAGVPGYQNGGRVSPKVSRSDYLIPSYQHGGFLGYGPGLINASHIYGSGLVNTSVYGSGLMRENVSPSTMESGNFVIGRTLTPPSSLSMRSTPVDQTTLIEHTFGNRAVPSTENDRDDTITIEHLNIDLNEEKIVVKGARTSGGRKAIGVVVKQLTIDRKF